MVSSEEGWAQDRLFDAWHISGLWEPRSYSWKDVAEADGFSSVDKERWGVLMAKRALFEVLDGARVVHRGDAPVWDDGGLGGFCVQGDLDVAWEGRSPIFEVKAYLPAVRLRGGRAPACQGLDWPKRQDYLNEQRRSGRPFYVLWVWPDPDAKSVAVLGKRVDLLEWPPPETSLNRRRGVKGMRMAYWYLDSLWDIQRLAEDVDAWSGAPFQPSLVSV